MVARVAVEVWHRVRERGRFFRRSSASLDEADLTRTFFAARQAPSGLGLPDAERARIIAEAERSLGGVLDLLGLGAIDCGRPIDWHRDPLTGARLPRSLLDSERRTDVDWTFCNEINRHRHLYALAQAYALTGDMRFRGGALEHIAAWLAANPPIKDRFWVDGLECGIRVVAWLWVLHLLESRGALEPQERSLLAGAVRGHARFIERELPRESRAYNHLIAPAGALAIAGAALPSLPESRRWLRTGIDTLTHEAARQFAECGAHREMTTGYHVFVLEIYTHVVLICRQNGIEVPPPITAALERMYDFVLALARPDGMLPNLGDEGLAWHQLSRRPLLDARRLLSTGAVLFARPDMKWAAGDFSEDSAWLLGQRGREQFEALERQTPSWTGRRLAGADLVVWRDGWEPHSVYFVFDAGVQGVPGAGHGHADALSFELFANRTPLIIDPGTFTFFPFGGWRQSFRGTSGHNTVAVDGVDQSEASTRRFRWARTADAWLRRCWSSPLLAFADASHEGYLRLPEPVRHRRLVFWVARRYWVVYDVLSGSGCHLVESFFHFPPLSVALHEDGLSCSAKTIAGGLRIVPLPTQGLEADLRCGETDPPHGWVSPAYGHKEPAPVLVYRKRGTLPLVLGAVLLPYQHEAPAVRVQSFELRRGVEPVSPSNGGCLRIERGNATVDQILWHDGGGVASGGELTTDAEVALVCQRSGEHPVGVCMPEGLLRWRGYDVDACAVP